MPMVGIVRDKNGVPKFDSPETASAEMKAMLTDRDILALPVTTVTALGLIPRLAAIQKEQN